MKKLTLSRVQSRMESNRFQMIFHFSWIIEIIYIIYDLFDLFNGTAFACHVAQGSARFLSRSHDAFDEYSDTKRIGKLSRYCTSNRCTKLDRISSRSFRRGTWLEVRCCWWFQRLHRMTLATATPLWFRGPRRLVITTMRGIFHVVGN